MRQYAIQKTKDKGYDLILGYDTERFYETNAVPVNTLQFFITNMCNLRCRGCFYQYALGKGEISFSEYVNYLRRYIAKIDKVIMLGGEPTLYKDLPKVIEYNHNAGLRTTVYTNGADLSLLEIVPEQFLESAKIRVGIYGSRKSEKPIMKIRYTRLPLTFVYMLRRDNVDELLDSARIAEEKFNCNSFYISSIRDIFTTGDYWLDTPETLSIEEYYKAVQSFVNQYDGNMDIHIARRGRILTQKEETQGYHGPGYCRFGNIFPNHKKVICPLDISNLYYFYDLYFNKRKCNKNSSCILTKIVLKSKKDKKKK